MRYFVIYLNKTPSFYGYGRHIFPRLEIWSWLYLILWEHSSITTKNRFNYVNIVQECLSFILEPDQMMGRLMKKQEILSFWVDLPDHQFTNRDVCHS